MNKRIKENTVNGTTNKRIYRILRLGLNEPYWLLECGICPYSNKQGKRAQRRKCHSCKPLKGSVKNWKEFRQFQCKQKN